MANQEQLEILKQGVKAWNKWREQEPETEVDLSGANLGKANLGGVYLGGANLSRAHLNEAYLVGAKLSRSNFGTKPTSAELTCGLRTSIDLTSIRPISAKPTSAEPI